jgi:hypothetical protein
MLNAAGRAQGIDPRSLFTGPESRARRYASEELLEHWQSHHRPTARFFAGKDSRVYEKYSAPRRRQYGVQARRHTITTGRGRDKRTIEVAVVKRDRGQAA